MVKDRSKFQVKPISHFALAETGDGKSSAIQLPRYPLPCEHEPEHRSAKRATYMRPPLTPIQTAVRLKVRKRRGESRLNRTSFRCVLQGRNPGRRRWWWNDRWTVVASNSIGQFPRGQPGSGSAAANVAAEIDQRELRPGRSEVERTAVIDANGAYVAGVHVLEGCRTGHPCADHRGARAVNAVILEVHVRDRVQVFYGEIADQHDRVVGVVKKAIADHLDVRVDTCL